MPRSKPVGAAPAIPAIPQPVKGAMYTSIWNRAVLFGGLGYFIDIYDLILFAMVRVSSLTDLGVGPDDMLSTGVLLLNSQMLGMLVGGVAWGIMGDKRGRLSVLFGSIALYSLANIANAFVQDVPQYVVVRFIAGFGLAGELGAGITLVAETMPKHLRGSGTTVLSSLGILGAVVGFFVVSLFDWQTAYIIGGVGGLFLLLGQFIMKESGVYKETKQGSAARGDLRMLFNNRPRFTKYLYTILVGVPVWFVIGILVTFSPELAQYIHVAGPIAPQTSILWCYIGASLGGFMWGFLGQAIKSRKWAVIMALTMCAALMYVYVFSNGLSTEAFYALCFFLGVSTGYWAVFVTIATEQFGTNLRATVTTTAPNFVRGATVPMTLGFQFLAGFAVIGLIKSAMIVGAVVLLLALISIRGLAETYGKDLDYVETQSSSTADASGTPLRAPAAVGAPAK